MLVSLLLTSCSDKINLNKCLNDNLKYFTEFTDFKEEMVKYQKYSDMFYSLEKHMLKGVKYDGFITVNDMIYAVEYNEQESEQKIKENYINLGMPFDLYVYEEGYCHIDSVDMYILLYGEPYRSNDNLFVIDTNDNDVLLKFKGEGITSIPSNIDYISGGLNFFDTDIKHLKMNKDLKRIGFGAFWGCENLILIDLNEGLKEISSYAFMGSKQLKRVIIPSSVERIGKSAFVAGDIYCEAETKPENWDDEFASGTAVVHWGDEWEYGKNNNIVLIEK